MVGIDSGSSTAPYEQLRAQLAAQVTSGELAAGARLATVRRLAEDLGLAPNTVARAYRELEADGFIETHGRNGTFVSAQGDAAERAAQDAAREYADRIRKLGVAPNKRSATSLAPWRTEHSGTEHSGLSAQDRAIGDRALRSRARPSPDRGFQSGAR